MGAREMKDGLFCFKPKVARTALLLSSVALLLITGCNEKKEGALSPELRNAAVAMDNPPPRYSERVVAEPQPGPVERAPSRSGGPQGPMTQAQLEEIYRLPAPVASLPRTQTIAPAVVPFEVPEDGRVVAEPSWDAQITREWRHIVIHHSASVTGSATEFDKWHRQKGWDGLGYHFVIGNNTGSGDGQVEVGYRWNKQAAGAHAGNAEYNQHGIGICLVGDFQNGGRPSARQMASLRQLTRFLQVKTGVPTSEVVGHCNVPDKKTECPGRSLDMNSFRASLGGGAIGVPIHMARAPKPAPASSTQLVRNAARSGASMP